jgi:hypothetical protein
MTINYSYGHLEAPLLSLNFQSTRLQLKQLTGVHYIEDFSQLEEELLTNVSDSGTQLVQVQLHCDASILVLKYAI